MLKSTSLHRLLCILEERFRRLFMSDDVVCVKVNIIRYYVVFRFFQM